MAAYIIVRVDITDPEGYGEYLKHSPRVIAEHGGRFIVRAGEMETVEGPTETGRIVVVEFPTIEDARAFYYSTNYQAAKKLREGAGSAQFIIIDGYPDEQWQSALSASQELSL